MEDINLPFMNKYRVLPSRTNVPKHTPTMDTEKHTIKGRKKERTRINKSISETPYEPESGLENWLLAIACAFFFPLAYLIGRAVIYLFG